MKAFSYRYAVSVAISVCIAFMLQYIYSFSNEYWIVFSAFLVSQTTRGTPFKQGMLIFLTMTGAIVVSLLLMSIHQFDVIYICNAIIFMGCSYWIFMNRPQSSKMVFVSMLFAITLLIASFSPTRSLDVMSDRIFDAAIGAMIAILCRLFIFPVKWDVEFSEGILPILNALTEYAQALTDEKNLAEKRWRVEAALLDMYPTWIYETGFNRGLRSGFRFFLVNVERITEAYFSMDDLIARGVDPDLMRDLHGWVENAMQKNQELLFLLSAYFRTGTIGHTTSDFTSDMTELEKAVQRVIPDNIEALAISPRFLIMTAFVRDIRDLRELLLQLLMALPVKDIQENKT